MSVRTGIAAIGILAALLFGSNLFQSAQAQQYAFRVFLSDKAGSPGVGAASQFLSAGSLARRQSFGISVDESDRPVSLAYIDTALQLTGGVLHLRSRWLNYIIVLTNDSSDIIPLSTKPWVTSTAYIAYYPFGLHNRAADGGKTEPTNPYYSQAKTTGTAAHYGATWDQTNLVKGDYLHDLGFKGTGKIIAVLDAGFSGVDAHNGFATLFSEGRLIDTYDFVRDTNASVFGYGTHGTQVLSIMAGDLPGTYVGSAPEARYALYITEDNGSEQAIEMDNMLAASERADSLGADVVNVSLGYNHFTTLASTSLSFSQLDGKTTIAARAANAATRKGILFVTTSGNEGGNSWNRILTPGDADSALTIGSVDANKVAQSTSGFGPNAAGKIKPDVCALGVNSANFSSPPAGIATGTGTSYAAPNIAGFAACLLEGRPGKTPMQVIEAINRTGDRYNSPTDQLGYGVPNFQQAYASLELEDTTPASALLLALAPNPAAGSQIWLDWKGGKADDEWDISIQDAAGRLVWQSVFATGSINGRKLLELPSQLSSGVYLVRVISDSSAQTLKLTVR